MQRDRKKVVWFEGMTLDPHHFQQWDRYHEGLLRARVRSLTWYDAGLTRLEIDRDRLANGEFALVHGRGIMPDGLFFDMPDGDDLPVPRNVQDYFPATQDRLGVFLMVPASRPDGVNVLLDEQANHHGVRHTAESMAVRDENTGGDERQITVSRANFEIRFAGEALASGAAFQVAEITRSAGGILALNERFVPTCSSISGAPYLVSRTRTLLERLTAKGGELYDRHRGAARQRDFSPGDALALGLLSTVHAYIPLLNHYHAHPHIHPEVLYTSLLTLAGQLSAYLPENDVRPASFPLYDHDQPTACFNTLFEVLLAMLGGASPSTNYVRLPLREQRENLYAAALEEGLLGDGTQFFLVARSDQLPEDTLVRELPRMLRIASPDMIDAVLRTYVPALQVEHTHRLPPGLPVDQQANYFQLKKQGRYWEAISASKALAVFVPAEFKSLNLQLVAVQEPGR